VRAADNILSACCVERTQARGAEWCVQGMVKLQNRQAAVGCWRIVYVRGRIWEVQVVNCMNNEASNEYVDHV
jgi:hypothetical protein